MVANAGSIFLSTALLFEQSSSSSCYFTFVVFQEQHQLRHLAENWQPGKGQGTDDQKLFYKGQTTRQL